MPLFKSLGDPCCCGHSLEEHKADSLDHPCQRCGCHHYEDFHVAKKMRRGYAPCFMEESDAEND